MLLQSSPSRISISRPCGATFPQFMRGEIRGYHVPLKYHEWVRSRLYAGGSISATEDSRASVPGHLPFGSSLSAPLACFPLRRLQRFTYVDHTTQLPQGWQSQLLLTVRLPTQPQLRLHCPEKLSHYRVTPIARPGRVLMAEH